MAGGWTKDGAVQDQIDASVADAVKHARDQLSQGLGRSECIDCGLGIPAARRSAVPGAQRCVSCQEIADASSSTAEPFNRRGSKDSQLR